MARSDTTCSTCLSRMISCFRIIFIAMYVPDGLCRTSRTCPNPPEPSRCMDSNSSRLGNCSFKGSISKEEACWVVASRSRSLENIPRRKELKVPSDLPSGVAAVLGREEGLSRARCAVVGSAEPFSGGRELLCLTAASMSLPSLSDLDALLPNRELFPLRLALEWKLDRFGVLVPDPGSEHEVGVEGWSLLRSLEVRYLEERLSFISPKLEDGSK
mmetsp:Transcript_43848/g.83734  ORF Transcript_43848/g.83734 Transcript_43848/m.83734 type:complete len:215 (+) Transcript_43848:1339-1983(+)